ncbi:glycosyltransferase family 39 protein [Streptomyces thermoalcalitolerans]|uniref:Glycosyltransferase family 39 protein n=1 Tax=Streptomyces thermoalcalitolerans TaxID=65605 RepID=A0ABP3Z0R0_9ACTN
MTRMAPALPGVLRRAAPALLGYAAVRTLGLLVLVLWSAAHDKSAYTLLTARWDALWYAGIAERGYGHEVRLPNGDVHSDLAFFPLLPWLERVLASVGPLSYADAGFVVSLVASLAAAWGIFAVADHVYGRREEGLAHSWEEERARPWPRRDAGGGRVGVWAVLLWAVLPVGIVQSMAYSESLFTALAAWTLYAVLTGRWVTAGVLASLAGLTRPVGLALVAAVWGAALVSFPRDRGAPPADGARRVLALLLAPLGTAGYVLWVGHRTGRGPLGYLDVQAGWRNGFDGGYAFARFAVGKLTSFPSALAGLGLIIGVAAVLGLYAVGVRQRQPLVLLVYSGVVTALALGASSYFGSKPRLLLPAFPLLLPFALALARSRPARSALVVGGVAVASALYGASWLNGSGPP